MKFRRKVKLMKGPTYHLMVVLALLDDLFDLAAATMLIAAPLIVGALGAAAGAITDV